MYKAEKEIFNQYEALKKTYSYILENSEKIRNIFERKKLKSITFTGSGSSYSLCKSAEISTKLKGHIPANSIAAGDFMMNFPHYESLIKDTVLVAPSRSGSTSEVVRAVEKAKKNAASVVSICTANQSRLSQLADLSLEMPWAFDESVCQTRTVTNLYTANLMMVAIAFGISFILDEIKTAIYAGDEYINNYKEILRNVSLKNWEKVVVLGDSELEGIAEEGALAFKEICRIPSNYYHILDVRHGPMVLIDNETLAIIACSPFGIEYQKDLISDIRNKGAYVVTVSSGDEGLWNSDINVNKGRFENYGVGGIPFIFVPQALSVFKAIDKGVNPDLPEGLEPWIKLK